MAYAMPKCRITVLKRTLNQDLADQYLDATGEFGLRDQFREGQQFIVEEPFERPEGVSSRAWADLRAEILAIIAGANYPLIKEPGSPSRAVRTGSSRSSSRSRDWNSSSGNGTISTSAPSPTSMACWTRPN